MRLAFFLGVAFLAVFAGPERSLASEFHSRLDPPTIAEGLELVRREYGKKNYESYYDGDVVLVRVRDKQSRSSYSPQVSEIGRFLSTACATEFGGRYRDSDGRIQLDHRVVMMGAGHVVNLVSDNGDEYLQEFRPLIESVVSDVQNESGFALATKSDDPTLRGGYKKSDIAHTCFKLDGASADGGERLKLIVSAKYVDQGTGKYVAIVIHGDVLKSLMAHARSENTEFAAQYASAKAADDKRKADARDAARQTRAAEKAAEERRQQEFRANLKIGDSTQCGYVIDIRPPMVEIAVSSGSRWFRVENLVPAGTSYSPCPEHDLRAVGSDRQEDSEQMCEAERLTCLANCDAQMTITDISAPRSNIILCRERCESIDCGAN